MHPNYKKGKYSKSLPGKLAHNYEASLDDPGIAGLSEALALCDTRLSDLTEQLHNADGLPDTILKACALLRKARQGNSVIDEDVHIVLLQEVLDLGANSDQIWDKMMSVIEQRRRVSESESRRIVSMGQAIPIGRVLQLLGLIGQSTRNIVKAHADSVTANLILRDTSRDLQRIVGPSTGGGYVPGSGALVVGESEHEDFLQ